MPRDYPWDSLAFQQIKGARLDRWHAENREHYLGLADRLWNEISSLSAEPNYLRPGDLYDVMLSTLYRDGLTQAGMKRCSRPALDDRNGHKWYSWFAWYVTEQYLESWRGAGP